MKRTLENRLEADLAALRAIANRCGETAIDHSLSDEAGDELASIAEEAELIADRLEEFLDKAGEG